MGNAFFVVWRESLEAFLIAGILYAWLQGNDSSGRGRRALFIGLGSGVGLALLLGWALVSAQDELSGNALEAFQIGILVVAAGFITQMVLWMRKHGRQMKAQLHADMSAAAKRSGFIGVAVVAALAIAREGAETVIFLYGLSHESGVSGASSLSMLAIGAGAGVLAAAATAWLAARGLGRLNIGLLLRLSSILLLVVASALLVSATDRMIGADWLPALVDPIYDASGWVDDTTAGGKLLADMSGYRARPALSTLLIQATYWAAVIFALRKGRHG